MLWEASILVCASETFSNGKTVSTIGVKVPLSKCGKTSVVNASTSSFLYYGKTKIEIVLLWYGKRNKAWGMFSYNETKVI